MMGKIDLVKEADGVLKIVGDVTFETANDFLKMSRREFDETTGAIVIDFSLAERVDSAAVALMIEWQCIADKKQKKLSFKHFPTSLLNLIKLSHLEHLFNYE